MRNPRIYLFIAIAAVLVASGLLVLLLRSRRDAANLRAQLTEERTVRRKAVETARLLSAGLVELQSRNVDLSQKLSDEHAAYERLFELANRLVTDSEKLQEAEAQKAKCGEPQRTPAQPVSRPGG